jgi:hypothetical protein
MPSWGIGFILGSLFLTNSLYTGQPLSFLNGAVGVFLYVVLLVNYYGKN